MGGRPPSRAARFFWVPGKYLCALLVVACYLAVGSVPGVELVLDQSVLSLITTKCKRYTPTAARWEYPLIRIHSSLGADTGSQPCRLDSGAISGDHQTIDLNHTFPPTEQPQYRNHSADLLLSPTSNQSEKAKHLLFNYSTEPLHHHLEGHEASETEINANRALLLVGVFCRDSDREVRERRRQTDNALAHPGIAIKFVVCNNNQSTADEALQQENETYNDIMLLPCMENTDGGKSFDYFHAVRQHFPGYTFYAKADTDTYILYHNVLLALSLAPR